MVGLMLCLPQRFTLHLIVNLAYHGYEYDVIEVIKFETDSI